MKTAPLSDEQERLYGGPPLDRAGTVIELGTSLLFAATHGDRNILHEGTVTKIHEPSHRGYGYMTRKLTVKRTDVHSMDLYQKKTLVLSYSRETVVINKSIIGGTK